MCGRLVLFILFNLWKLRKPFCEEQIIENLIQTILCWKGKWQYGYTWLCMWFCVLVKKKFCSFYICGIGKCCSLICYFPCVCLCVLEEKRMLGIHNICNLSAKTDILNLLSFFFFIMCANWSQSFAQWNYVLKYFDYIFVYLKYCFQSRKC